MIMNNAIIRLYDSKDNIIFEKKNNEATFLTEIKNNNEIFNKEILNNINDLYLEIKYKNSNNEEIIKKVDLVFKKDEGKSNQQLSSDTRTLLKNNNYQKVSEEKYKKEYFGYIFYFYPQKNKIIYIKSNNDENIYAEMNIKGQNQYLKYEISKDDKLIEKYDSDKKNSQNNHMWEIHEIMYNEYLKISAN